MNSKVQKVLEAAIKAPSGSNSQPWMFKLTGYHLEVFAEYKKDHPILNYRNRGTFIAHGALLENIIISSRSVGLKANVKVFPDNNPEHTLTIDFEETDPIYDPLYSGIEKRTTNRKPYKKLRLSPEQKDKLKGFTIDFPHLKLVLEENSDNLEKLGEALSINEVITLENKELHRLFFNEINWNEKQDKEKCTGFYLKTMELDPPKEIALRLFKSWNMMNIFNKLRFARQIAKSNAKVYSSAGAIGGIIVRDIDSDFFDAGRLMQRIWLWATINNLSFHLVTGILYFWQRLEKIGLDVSDEHKILIRSAYENISKTFFADKDNIIALVFRIGTGGEPSAYSRRIPLDKIVN